MTPHRPCVRIIAMQIGSQAHELIRRRTTVGRHERTASISIADYSAIVLSVLSQCAAGAGVTGYPPGYGVTLHSTGCDNRDAGHSLQPTAPL
jgi:hypothetical protein